MTRTLEKTAEQKVCVTTGGFSDHAVFVVSAFTYGNTE
jgi:hypothetical protein